MKPQEINQRDIINTDFEIKDIESTIYLKDVDSTLEMGMFSPLRINAPTVVVCTKGSLSAIVNSIEFKLEASNSLLLFTNSLIDEIRMSDDFEAKALVLTMRFTDRLSVGNSASILLKSIDNPLLFLNEDVLGTILEYFKAIEKLADSKEDQPYKLKIAEHLTMAVYYRIIHYLTNTNVELNNTRNKVLLEEFFELIEKNFKSERNVGFYASKLCLTPKYLSSLIKSISGKSAAEWIDSRVILEAKNYLRSSKYNIQQISNELSFSTQSQFGRYFKRQQGISPSNYRKETINANK